MDDVTNEVKAKAAYNGIDSSLLFFFLLLVILMRDYGWFDEGNEELLFFFLLLVVIMKDYY